ncbi:DUF4127 family protein [Meiothermus sp. QL-1]|uniref:DUF4127 family protein n=1 Tax=Meiothermus sp. QL-1 TaxID=2058095 RepID=UPI000E0A6AAE|nr:DUF4127 family protein [Meiothermus sp. QL-1]RDI95953.1 DUF4127 family protein [Meiothermus sp. QL-1]
MRSLWLTLGLLSSLAWAYPSGVVYIPLDDRPPNWSPCRWELVRCPPREVYRGRKGADLALLWGWLVGQPGQMLVASLDALVYGGLVQSRSARVSVEEARRRLGVLRYWQATWGPVLAFGVIPRHPDAVDRGRNLALLRGLEGFSYVEAPWDDALPGSPAVAEAATLDLPTRPGADEAGQVMLLRALNPGLRVRVLYDHPQAPEQIARYDGIALGESVRRLLASAKAIEVSERPDLVLLVYTGRDPRQGLLGVLQGLRQAPVAIADIARVNRGDPALMRYLLALDLYPALAAYAAWGTPSNNLGAALAQGGLFAPLPCQRAGNPSGFCEQRRTRALAQAYLEYLWGEVGRPWVRAHFTEPLGEEAAHHTLKRLQAEPMPRFPRGALVPTHLRFPWQRSFEAEWAYRFSGED